MRIGIPTEIKNHEYRVAITPAGVREFTRRGHEVIVQSGAGLGSALTDQQYAAAGATLGTAAEAWAAPLVMKVKEPVESEYGYLRADLTLFTYLHLAADPALVDALLDAGTTAIAYETVQLPDRSLPLLAPMSEVAGRLSVLVGGYHLLGSQGGRGSLLGGVPGVRPAKVAVIGAGISGGNAVAQAVGMGADVTVLDLSLPRLREVDAQYRGAVKTVASSAYEIERAVTEADLVIGAVLVPGAKAPRLVTREMVAGMQPGSVLVDIAIDQGGCFEDSHPTTHEDPTFPVERSIFYCVANMPGAAAATSTPALTNATLPYALAIADRGWADAVAADPALAGGLSTHSGRIAHPAVAAAFPDRPAEV
ncbi:alanine dehydrogenase [Microbacterium telephonicum]|uniref:Alanine dehydrogenase n=1 Tax=Microbacterium telephonicum TaxID=1714841 RepID=A0A498C8T6_9MICO|nr:alanine dehydrogenase [Microbacterium telephonicum]RLK52245.1 alanine dehydrogenase [Microbacterium telephonicum]